MKKFKKLTIVSLGALTIYTIGKIIKENIEIRAYEDLKNEIDEVYNENMLFKADFNHEKIKNEKLADIIKNLNNKIDKLKMDILNLDDENKTLKERFTKKGLDKKYTVIDKRNGKKIRNYLYSCPNVNLSNKDCILDIYSYVITSYLGKEYLNDVYNIKNMKKLLASNNISVHIKNYEN